MNVEKVSLFDYFHFNSYFEILGITLNSDLGFKGSSHLELRSSFLEKSSRYENINITFSATEENGLLMWKCQEDTVGNGDDFILLHIKDGRPTLEYELGGGFY